MKYFLLALLISTTSIANAQQQEAKTTEKKIERIKLEYTSNPKNVLAKFVDGKWKLLGLDNFVMKFESDSTAIYSIPLAIAKRVNKFRIYQSGFVSQIIDGDVIKRDIFLVSVDAHGNQYLLTVKEEDGEYRLVGDIASVLIGNTRAEDILYIGSGNFKKGFEKLMRVEE